MAYYCQTRSATDEIASRLTEGGVATVGYHAGLSASARAEAQRKWQTGEVAVVAATVAFGMGIDKADVRLVAHWQMPASFEALYQEAGRAARDGQRRGGGEGRAAAKGGAVVALEAPLELVGDGPRGDLDVRGDHVTSWRW